MKILQVHVPYREAGGEDAVVAAEAALLRAAGHTVIQHLSPNPTAPAKTAAALALAPNNPRSAAAVRQLVAEHKPDVAHVHNTWFSVTPAVITALRRAAVPVVATLHNYRLLCANALLYRDGHPCTDCVGRAPWPGVVHRCYRSSAVASTAVAATIALNRRRWARDVDVFLVLNSFAKGMFAAGGLPTDKMVVKPNSVIDPGSRTVAPSDSRVVLFVGRLSHEKGLETLLAAWAQSSLEGLQLHILGDGPMSAALREKAPDSVHFLGHQTPEAVRQAMLSARALVFPSTAFEGQPLVILEALAAGLPVIASATGAVGELVGGHGDRGWLAVPGDAASWGSALRMLDQGALLDEAGAAARQLFEQQFTADVALDNLVAAYALAGFRARGVTAP